MTSPQIIVGRQRHRDHDGDERNHDVVGAHAEKCRVLLGHAGLPVAASGFTIVVLASHSPARNTVLRLLAIYPRFSKKPLAVSLASTATSLAPRAAASFSSASQSMEPAPCPAAAGCT